VPFDKARCPKVDELPGSGEDPPSTGAPVSDSGCTSQGFPKTARIRKRSEYLAIQGRGRKLQTENFVVFVAASPSSPVGAGRVGVTVSKRVGHAVVRNRVKRIVREVCRRRREQFPQGIDFVFVAKRSAADLEFARADQEIERLCERYFSRK
jgi:ribonuclease P protein component